jgi:hypothetical protein
MRALFCFTILLYTTCLLAQNPYHWHPREQSGGGVNLGLESLLIPDASGKQRSFNALLLDVYLKGKRLEFGLGISISPPIKITQNFPYKIDYYSPDQVYYLETVKASYLGFHFFTRYTYWKHRLRTAVDWRYVGLSYGYSEQEMNQGHQPYSLDGFPDNTGITAIAISAGYNFRLGNLRLFADIEYPLTWKPTNYNELPLSRPIIWFKTGFTFPRWRKEMVNTDVYEIKY